jgi:hypothetical protein
MKQRLIKSAGTALAAICMAGAYAQTPLPPVKDVPATIGNASRATGPFSFCTLPDPAPLAAAQAAAGSKPFLIGWTIEEAPAPMAKVVAITNLPTARLSGAGCKQVQALTAGGVDQIKLHVPYAIVDKVPDWSVGFTALVMAQKNDDMPAADYIPRLKRHVKLVTQLFESKGMDGYIVYAGENFEWAYLHWTDEDTAKRAFATPDGATGPQDSRSIQRPLSRKQIFPAAK